MVELAEDFKALNDYKMEQRGNIEPKRFEYAIKKLEEAGARVTPKNDGSKSLLVEYKHIKVTFYPFTGWASGKNIKDGRGIHNLLKQLEAINAEN